ncbi:Triose-phosphate Transporter family protein [Theileria parva strain Muguga]|uniref:Phosphate translocator, putative n=1 Tax=Theileria parva TaxID=5875 RepID=Q4MZI0_THEPA|nr:Triose-phosphate Transporter family protein [Theileria parva strain Muguga]EAN31281.1 Triose-phosphate Transporter family protein [Theileria parva strain Muguga]|eukprot:XP_763564.1 phosphate translocator [Theileria parva strain Muguga]
MENPTKEPRGDSVYESNFSDLDTLLPPSAFPSKAEALRKYVSFPNFSWRLVGLFFGWYLLNVAYVIENKVILNLIPLPWTLSCLQLTVGWLFAILFWATGFRNAPRLKSFKVFLKVFLPQGLCHLFVHLGAVVSMGIGAVSFTHVVKSAEPVVTALFSALFLDDFLNLYAYVSLIPVVVGVALASVKELNFSWVAFWFAMLSNAGSSLRSVFAKLTMKNKNELGTNLTSSNIYMLLTLTASVGSVFLAFLSESAKWVPYWTTATLKMTDKEKYVLLLRAFFSCVCYFLCNEMSFICLGEVNQVSHAIANTLKRIVLITSSIVAFGYKITTLGYFGMTIAILGALAYSIFK